jgi:DNA-directed RNA polymerase specialized sigma24 family protein
MDTLLRPFVQATEEEDADRRLAEILRNCADPLISQILRHKLRVLSSDAERQRQDAEDIRSEARACLLTRLRRLRHDAGAHPIKSFLDYVAVVTYNTFHEYLRRKYPAHHRIKNGVRYVLTHAPGFAMWKSDQHSYQCGLAGWQKAPSVSATSARLQELRNARADFLSEAGINPDPRHLPTLLTAILKRIGAPVDLDELATTVAHLQGVGEEAAGLSFDDDALAEPPDARPDTEAEMDRRRYLERIWLEICALPVRQRTALLLHLDEIHALPVTGIASIHRVAQVLGLQAPELAAFWNELPWEDSLIARHLGVTRQQVINLRKAARDRLTRRMKRSRGSDVA